MAKNPTVKIGLFHMLRDVLVAALNKGQFLWALGALILTSMIWKTPAGYMPQLWKQFFDALARWHLQAYLFSVLTTIGWFTHARYQRAKINSEMKRIAKERTEWQATSLPHKLESSEL